MNKKIIVITILSMVTGLVIFNIGNKKENDIKEMKKQITNSNMLTMMLETEAGTGNYEEVTQSEWPQDGYVFNASLSRCENGGTLSWDDGAKKVIMKSNISDKCYVYFDKYNIINITSVTASEITNNSITLNVSATAGNNPIETYYYSNNNGLSYQTSSSNTYTFSGLEAGVKYNFIVYAIDSAGYKSNEYTLQTTTESGVNFANYIINTVYTSDGANDLYYHDGVGTYTNASQEAGDNSYRYSGANPNNYVCFGSDAATCPNDNLYRIIGLFDDDKDGIYNIKLIKNTSIGDYAWDSGNSNTWNSSTKPDIRTTLNSTFLGTINSAWQSKIATHVWKVGGMAQDNSATAKEYYNTEIGSSSSSTTDNMKIGLMYVSDYGYAAAPSNWTTALNDYDNATSTNWLYLDDYEWTISRRPGYTSYAFFVDGPGFVYYYNVTISSEVRPSFYLESSVVLTGGTGTLSDPYKLSVD